MSIPFALQPQNLQGVYQSFADEVPSVLGQFFPDLAATDAGQQVQYDTLEFGRGIAGINVRGGAPRPVAPTKRATVVGSSISMSEAIYIPPHVTKDLRDVGSKTTSPASVHIAREMKQLRLRIGRRKAVFMGQALGTASGNLSFTPPGYASAETVSLNYRTSSENHTVIGSGWATATTDILANIRAAKKIIAKQGGARPTHMVMNSATGEYLSSNNAIYELLSDAAKDRLLEVGYHSRLCELDIVYCDEDWIDDVTGASTMMIPDNHVAILAGNNEGRGMIECEPQSEYAPAGTRGVYFHTVMETHINGGAWIEYQYDVFPLLALPDRIVFDTTVA